MLKVSEHEAFEVSTVRAVSRQTGCVLVNVVAVLHSQNSQFLSPHDTVANDNPATNHNL